MAGLHGDREPVLCGDVFVIRRGFHGFLTLVGVERLAKRRPSHEVKDQPDKRAGSPLVHHWFTLLAPNAASLRGRRVEIPPPCWWLKITRTFEVELTLTANSEHDGELLLVRAGSQELRSSWWTGKGRGDWEPGWNWVAVVALPTLLPPGGSLHSFTEERRRRRRGRREEEVPSLHSSPSALSLEQPCWTQRFLGVRTLPPLVLSSSSSSQLLLRSSPHLHLRRTS